MLWTAWNKKRVNTGTIANESYYDEEAIRFIETICIFATLDAQHRFVVRALARLLNFHVLAKQKNIRASLCELLSESYIIIFFISFFFFWNRHVLNFTTRKILLHLKKFCVGLLMGANQSLCCGTSLGHSTALGTVSFPWPLMIGLWQLSMHVLWCKKFHVFVVLR